MEEQEPMLSHTGSSESEPSWAGESITSLTMFRPAKPRHRLDVFPFITLYCFLIFVSFFYRLSRFSFLLTFGFLVMLHILAFLAQHWSVSARTLFSWTRVRRLDPEDLGKNIGIFVKLVPPPHRGKTELVPLRVDHGRLNFTFQKRMYEYHVQSNSFNPVTYPVNLPLSFYAGAARSPSTIVNDSSLGDTEYRFGRNELEIPLPKFWDMYRESLLSPFFVFQMFCMVLWMLDDIWKYAILTMGMMLAFEAIVVSNRMRSLKELRGMRNRPRDVFVYRDKRWTKVRSTNLFPGDILSVTRSADPSDVIPCDCLLLSGGAVVNESMLTGESVPLIKEALCPVDPVSASDLLCIKSSHKAHILFGGTRVLTHTSVSPNPATPPNRAPDGGAIAFVLRTSFASAQGELLTTLLYSTETLSANSWESLLFILFLLLFAVAAALYVLYHALSDPDRSRYDILVHCVLIITSVVPPELPMQLSLAVNTSLIALARNQVFCTEPFRIPYAGKIDIACFDKTGTITTDSIIAAGVALPSEFKTIEDDRSREEGSELAVEMRDAAKASFEASCVLAGCHSLVHVGADLVGDPLELAALKAVKWTFSAGEVASAPRGSSFSGSSVRIMARHRFLSSLQRMSVVASVSRGGGEREVPTVLVKGSPEAIGRLLRCMPAGYDGVAKSLARRGLRVLSLAGRKLSTEVRLSDHTKMSREEAEANLEFYGFICFECPLRSESRKVIRVLRKSSTDVCMITGDATLTAVHVAKTVGMTNKHILILERDRSSDGANLSDNGVVWVSAASGKRKKRWELDFVESLSHEWDLCVGGPALDWVLERNGADADGLWKNLKFVKVFARMTPVQKEKILVALKNLGIYTLMCGDGTNDVGALKQAHVGVALLSGVPAASQDQPPSFNRPVRDTQPTRRPRVDMRAREDVKKRRKPPRNRESTSSEGRLSNMRRLEQQRRDVLESKIEELNAALANSSDEPPLVKLGDASIASPFTSKKMSIESCVSIIRQGRCTLATTLQMYQILALNCLIQAYSLSILRLDGVKLGDAQMTIGALLVAIAFFLISRGKPLKKLSPERPPTSVFTPRLFLSLIGQFAVHLGTLMWVTRAAKLLLPASYKPMVDGEFSPNVLNSVVYLLATAQQISVFLVNYKGRPHMEGLLDNKYLLGTLSLFVFIVGVCTFEVWPQLNEGMELVPWPSVEIRTKVVISIVVDIIGSFAWDFVMVNLFRPRLAKIR